MKKKNIKNIFIIVLCVFVIIPLVFILFDITPHMYKESLDEGEISDINQNISGIQTGITDIQDSITDIQDGVDISENTSEIHSTAENINSEVEDIEEATEPFKNNFDFSHFTDFIHNIGFSTGMEGFEDDEDEDENKTSFQIDQVRINGVSVPGNSTIYSEEQPNCTYYIGEKSNQPKQEVQNINSFDQNTYTYTYL